MVEMKLSLQSDFALRVLMHAAVRGNVRTTVDEVASAHGISRNHLVKVVHRLGKAGYLHTQKGSGGGFTLAREPGRINVGEVVRLGESDDRVIDCQHRGVSCRLRPSCNLKWVLDEAADMFFRVLERYTLEDLISGKSEQFRTILGDSDDSDAVN